MLQFLGSEVSKVGAKGFRGLAYSRDIYSVRPNIIRVVDNFRAHEELEPGKEKEVSVETELPPNANVHSISATLYVNDSEINAEPQQTSVGIRKNDEAETSYELKVGTPVRPTNIQIRLDQGEPIWNFGGTLAEATYSLPDFSHQLNAYLDHAKPKDGKIGLRFFIKSDTPGRVGITINPDVDFTLIQTQSWINDLDNTVRLDRNFPLEFSSFEKIVLDPISGLPAGTSLLNIKLDVSGELGPERLWGSVASFVGNDFATISGQYSIAQRIIVNQRINCAGLSLLLTSDAEAELYAELQTDKDGYPSSETPLSKANFSLSKSEPHIPVHWTYVPFEQQANLDADVAYWIVIKGIRGAAYLFLESNSVDEKETILVNRGGPFWRSIRSFYGSEPMGMIRLVYLPKPDNKIAALEAGLEGTAIVTRVDPTSNVQNIVLEVPSGTTLSQPVLILRSYGRGSLTLANVIQEYGMPSEKR